MSLGQSGFSVSMWHRDGQVLVRKAAGDAASALRLERQYFKHLEIERTGLLGPLLVPKIVLPFKDGGYSMEYAPGLPLGFALEVMSQSEVLGVSEKISAYLRNCTGNQKASIENDNVLSKIESLEVAYSAMEDGTAKALGTATLGHIRRLLEEIEVRTSFNHGDFSMENLISDRRGEEIYAIDFLDSPYQTFLADVGRFWLDLSTRWWAIRSAPSATAWTNLAALRNHIFLELRDMGLQVATIDMFAALAALRILPYTKVPYRSAILKSVLRKACEAL